MKLTVLATRDAPSAAAAGLLLENLKRSGFMNKVCLELLDCPPVCHGNGKFMVLNRALNEEEGSAAVCGMEDLPLDLPDGLRISFLTRRLSRGDRIVAGGGYTRISTGSSVACPGTLRSAQMLRARGDLKVSDIRACSESILLSVEEKLFDACVLPAYELEFMKYTGKGSIGVYELTADYFVPVAGQGAIALMTYGVRFPDKVLGRINDDQTEREVSIELEVMRTLSPVPDTPLGISCTSFGNGYRLAVQLLSRDGRHERKLIRSIAGKRDVAGLLHYFSDDMSLKLLR